MHLHLPNSAFLGNIDPFLQSMNLENTSVLHVSANKKWISVHPVVLAMVAALGLRPDVRVECEPFEARSKHYFERMGLFRMLNVDSRIDVVEHEPAGRFIPLTTISSGQELTAFMGDITTLLHLVPAQAQSLRYIMSELVRNVLEHAKTPIGAVVAVQYYEKSNTIRVGIVDVGIGIRAALSQSWQSSSDLEAIHLALQPGITGTTRREGGTDYNAGAGLFFIKSIASVSRDFFMVYSGDSMYKLLKQSSTRRVKLHGDPTKDRHSFNTGLPYWQGTAIGVDVTLENTPEFSQLLDTIRDVYGSELRARRQERFRKPKFI